MDPIVEIKSGPGRARFLGVKPEVVLAMNIAMTIFAVQIGRRCIFTSGMDGAHSYRSLHYKGLAFDIRTKHLTDEEKDLALSLLIRALGDDYDVVLESRGQVQEHIHVEWDPKGAY